MRFRHGPLPLFLLLTGAPGAIALVLLTWWLPWTIVPDDMGPIRYIMMALPYVVFGLYGIYSGLKAGLPGNVALGVLMLLAVVTVASYIRDGKIEDLARRQSERRGANAEALGRALLSYAQQHDGILPRADRWAAVVGRSATLHPRLAGAKLTDLPDPALTILLSETMRAVDHARVAGGKGRSCMRPYPRGVGDETRWVATADGKSHDSTDDGLHW